jgi:hypothetical protein
MEEASGHGSPIRFAVRREVEFEKAANAFDVSAFSLLAGTAIPVGEALPRLEGREELVSNLLAVTALAPRSVLIL